MHLKSITSGWRIAAGIVALVVLVPLWQILSHAVAPAGPVWEHLRTTLLPELISNTFLLLAGVGSVTLVLGTSLAWLTGACEFPGRKFFAKALLLPFAVPAYVLAFTTLGLLDFSGPVQGALRLVAPDLVRSLPDVRTPGMVIAVLSLAFYPYTYLLARNAFATRGRTAMEAARTL
ncbi:MAG TPA: iron ABC transporter permease, partial [Desulfomicrobiaceae bacterium]|nr:iron ABC transporter permease [Desulfomicrobiaceae bacterium]